MTSEERVPRVVDCPICGKPVVWVAESRFRPFCSARCKEIDLGTWASEGYRVPDPGPVFDEGESE
jgi:endogenous inhibitor of DNA gyrase (YacG/DUF329 family)